MRRQTIVFFASALAILGLAAGCADIDPVQAPAPATGTADFTRLVAIGNSLTAGYQNGGLVETRQAGAFAALIARQVGKEVLTHGVVEPRVGDFVIPGYGEPGTAGTVRLVSLVPPDVEEITNPGQPVNLTYPAVYNDLGIPAADVSDVLNTVTSPTNPFFDLVLRGKGTMLEQAMSLHPTFVILWVGGNDLLKQVTRGIPATEVNDFSRDYRQMVDALLSLDPAPGIVAANIPDVTTIPYVTTVPPFLVNETQQPVLVNGHLVPLIGSDGPLALPGPNGPGDFVTLDALALIKQGIGIPQALGGTGEPLPDRVVVTRAEVALLHQRVRDLNTVIAEEAARHGYPVVDTYGMLMRWRDRGVEVGGLHYDGSFLVGGLFSLDGIHPTDMGQALVANEFIRAINAAYGASIQFVDLSPIASLRLFPEEAGRVPLLNPTIVSAMRTMLRPPVFGPPNTPVNLR